MEGGEGQGARMEESDCEALTAGPNSNSDTGAEAAAFLPSPDSGGHVMAFSRTLRQKLRSAGFRPVAPSTGAGNGTGTGTGTGNGEEGLSRQVSETPSTSSRMVTVVQNIYVYVSGAGTADATTTVLSRPLRLRKPRPADAAFLDDDNPKYRACCHKCHVTRSPLPPSPPVLQSSCLSPGAFIIGLVELVFAAMNLVDAVRHVVMTGSIVQSLFELTFAIAFVVAVVLMIIGVRTERKSFLMPHLVWFAPPLCSGQNRAIWYLNS